jgi:hypothetical protein
MSRAHLKNPYVFRSNGNENRVEYVPGDSDTSLFGGNSNWRGPIWFPVNYLLIEALERYHHFYEDTLKVECPTGSGNVMNLLDVARELAGRLTRIFLPDPSGQRPCYGGQKRFAEDPGWQNLLQFHEYFHGDSGLGLGASHQTGWTGLVIPCLEDVAKGRAENRTAVRPSPELRERLGEVPNSWGGPYLAPEFSRGRGRRQRASAKFGG